MVISRPISEDVVGDAVRAAAVAEVKSVDEEDFEEVLWQKQQQQQQQKKTKKQDIPM